MVQIKCMLRARRGQLRAGSTAVLTLFLFLLHIQQSNAQTSIPLTETAAWLDDRIDGTFSVLGATWIWTVISIWRWATIEVPI